MSAMLLIENDDSDVPYTISNIPYIDADNIDIPTKQSNKLDLQMVITSSGPV